jgi:hypothetical protein
MSDRHIPSKELARAALNSLERSYFAACMKRAPEDRSFVMGNVGVHDLAAVVRFAKSVLEADAPETGTGDNQCPYPGCKLPAVQASLQYCVCGLVVIPEGELRVEVGPTTHRLAGRCFHTPSANGRAGE